MNIVLLILLSTLNFQVNQSTSEQKTIGIKQLAQNKTGGLYNLSIRVANELTTGSWGRSTSLTEDESNLLKTYVENKCSEKLDADVVCIYRYKKNGKKWTTAGYFDLEDMPTNSLRNTLKNYEKDLFINLSIDITNDGKPLRVHNTSSNIMPRVRASIKVHNNRKEIVFKNDFEWDSLENIIHLKKQKDPLSPQHQITIVKSAVSSILQ